jgi:hypothetical protein
VWIQHLLLGLSACLAHIGILVRRFFQANALETRVAVQVTKSAVWTAFAFWLLLFACTARNVGFACFACNKIKCGSLVLVIFFIALVKPKFGFASKAGAELQLFFARIAIVFTARDGEADLVFVANGTQDHLCKN